ncbi:hypothetical protein GCM10028807_47800 [Spirosoma daeguense]
MNTKSILVGLALFVATVANGQKKEETATFRRHFISTSGFVLGNLFPDPPSFFQLNAGYWLTKKDVLSVEAITWKYSAPLGIPYGDSFGDVNENYPGHIRGIGVGLAYQRYIWKGLYAAAHATPFLQQYKSTENVKIQNGFQLFTAFRVGYHIPLFRNRFFIEPSVAMTYWPVNTNMPESFARMERKWKNHFFPEPGLHLGVKF